MTEKEFRESMFLAICQLKQCMFAEEIAEWKRFDAKSLATKLSAEERKEHRRLKKIMGWVFENSLPDGVE